VIDTLDGEIERAWERATTKETLMTAPVSGSETLDTAAGSGIAGTGSQARVSAAQAETMADFGQGEAYATNLKRIVDDYAAMAVRLQSNALSHDQQLHTIALQALQNAVTTSDMVAKQTTRHHDIAIDRQWNLDEVASRSVMDTAAIADMLKKSFGTTDLAEILTRAKA